MRKKGHINFVGILLATLYLFSSSSYVLFHHHNSQHIVHSQAKQCEQAVYFTDKDQGCKHQEHFTQHVKKCLLCDHHTISLHTLLPHQYGFYTVENNEYFSKYSDNLAFVLISATPNKDPPRAI